MRKNPNGSLSLDEHEKINNRASANVEGEVVNNFWRNMEAMKKEAEEIYDNKIENREKTEKPSKEAFVNAYIWYKELKPKNKDYLTIVDFHPSDENPWGLFYIIDMKSKPHTVVYSNKVGHWVNSRGKNDSPSWSPDSYSNERGSKQSSLGFFKTAEHIVPWGKHIRQWLKLTWEEKGINDNANARDIYIHPAGLDQSDWCFTLPYDKAEWEKWEKEIHDQLLKIRWESVVFAYDSRVFKDYAKQSKFFSDVEDPGEGAGFYTINGREESTIRDRIKNNKEEPELFSIYDRGAEKLNNMFPRILDLPNAIKKNRECWWKKKEVEMFAAQILKETKEKEWLNDLNKNINKTREWFRENFYKSKPKDRRENIDKWVSKFWEDVNNLISESGKLTNLEKSLSSKKSEYEKWEEESAKNHRKIPENERAEARLQREIEDRKRKLSA